MRVTTSRDSVRHHLIEAGFSGTGRERALHGSCSNPVMIEMTGRPDQVSVGLGTESDKALFAEATVRCRKCPECLKHRATLWAARACDEIGMSGRTWFGTMTLNPANQARVMALARRATRVRRAEDFDQISEAEQFLALSNQSGADVTLWLKRVRKASNARLRYLLVCEAHKSGLPHWHMLLHEVGEDRVTKRMLEDQWRIGFSQWRLVDAAQPQAAFYVTKYLTKSLMARVRASSRYGSPRIGARVDAAISASHLAKATVSNPACLKTTGPQRTPTELATSVSLGF